MRTQVGIVGAGPAGLVLSHLLHQAGIESVVVEARSREYCENRVRAGLLEYGSVELLKSLGLANRLQREGMVHHGVSIRHAGQSHYLPYDDGVTMTIYAQQEVVKDLIAARLTHGGRIEFNAAAMRLSRLDEKDPRVHYVDQNGVEHELVCDFVAGCDGFHGISRPAIPDSVLTVFNREYPFAWLGILAKAPPLEHELVYTSHERGFALFTMRSESVARHYLQVPVDEDIAGWPDPRIWEELHARLGGDGHHTLVEGEIFQKSVTPMRSFACSPMQFGRLFLAGDAAHIVPPTGAKGMNLAIGDVAVLAERFIDYYAHDDNGSLAAYSETVLRRVWKAQRFSWWMTTLLHRIPDMLPFDREMQQAELEYLTSSRSAARSFVENYSGLPFEIRGIRPNAIGVS